ncbi:MAG: hypothetical protein V4492_07070 [Chlamydiota bacterium]
MDQKKPKEGVSVKEIEEFAKKHRFEVFFCLAFLFACFFTFVMWGPGWSIIAAAAGAILGVLLSGKIEHLAKTIFQFIFKQEKTTQLVLGIVALIIAIFIPPLIFLMLGLHGGKDMYHKALEIRAQNKP